MKYFSLSKFIRVKEGQHQNHPKCERNERQRPFTDHSFAGANHCHVVHEATEYDDEKQSPHCSERQVSLGTASLLR